MDNNYYIDSKTMKLEQIQPTQIQIFDAITIHRDGRVDVDPKYTTDEAAKLFWKAIRDMAPSFLNKDK
jgi:hypothetical protein